MGCIATIELIVEEAELARRQALRGTVPTLRSTRKDTYFSSSTV